LIISYTVLFGLLGALMIAVGLFLKLSSTKTSFKEHINSEFPELDEDSLNTAVLFGLAIGSLIVFISILGLIGASMRSKTILAIYFLVQIVFFIQELCFVVYRSMELAEIPLFCVGLLAIDLMIIACTVYLIGSIFFVAFKFN
jgi:hypothetical protein